MRTKDEAREGRCDIWTVDVESGRLARVTPNDGRDGSLVWSPDDRSLTCAGAQLPKRGANAILWSVPSKSGSLRQVTLADICVGPSLMADTGAPSWATPR